MLMQDEPSTSRDAKILRIRGSFYGKIKYTMPVSGRSYPRNDKLWNTISQISETASTIYGSSALSDRAFWRFIILDVYKLDERVWDQGARNNFDADVEALTLCWSKPETLCLLASSALDKYFIQIRKGIWF
jgi:hypothetical protein